MSCVRAESSSSLTLGIVEMQRGRAPQFTFMKSRIRRAVVLGSTVAGLSSGTGGGFTVAHSVVMSLAWTGRASTPAKATARTMVQQDALARCLIMPPFAKKKPLFQSWRSGDGFAYTA